MRAAGIAVVLVIASACGSAPSATVEESVRLPAPAAQPGVDRSDPVVSEAGVPPTGDVETGGSELDRLSLAEECRVLDRTYRTAVEAHWAQ